jgi:hypothetical protein
MDNKQILGIVGAVLLIAGIFMPLVKIPILGGVSFYDNNQAEAIIVIALAVISMVFIVVKRYSLLAYSNIAMIVVMLSAGIQIARRMMSAKSTAQKLIGEKLTEKITGKAMEHVHYQWGVAILILGLILIILCAMLGRKKKATKGIKLDDTTVPR